MNRQLLLGGLIGAVVVTAVGSVAGYRLLETDDYAQVVSVEPYMETVSTPTEVCREEIVTRKKEVKDPHQITGTIAGAVIGGVLGSKIGGGSGKDIATVGGAVAGGYAGNKAHEKIQEGNTEQSVQQVCETYYDTSEVQDGYEVVYELDGKEHVVRMAYDPGDRITLENGRPVLEPPQ